MTHRRKPVMKTGRRRHKAVRTVPIHDEFLTHISNGMSFQAACEMIGKSRSSMYKWVKNDTEFAGEVELAFAAANDRVHDEVWRRGVRGIRKAVWNAGKIVGYERIYSDRMLELRARRTPEYAALNNQKLSVEGNVSVRGVIMHLTEDQVIEEMRKRGLPVVTIED